MISKEGCESPTGQISTVAFARPAKGRSQYIQYPGGVISKSPFEIGAADFRIFLNLVTLDRYLILCQGNKKGKIKDLKFILSPFYQRNILILMSYAVNHLL